VRRILAAAAALSLFACNERSANSTKDMAAQDIQVAPSAPPQDFSARGGAPSVGYARPAAEAVPPSPAPDVTASQPSLQDPAQQAMIIKTGDASIEVDSLDLAIAQVTQLAKRLGGQLAGSAIETGRKDFPTAQITLRIPSAQFDAALSGLGSIGKVESQNVSTEDVTEQYVDMTARMTNAKRLEDRLIALLANRTGKLEEVLAVERELARVREEIERYEGRLRYLRTRAAVSTLSISLHEPFPITGQPGSNVIVESFKQAWRNFVSVVASIIASLGVLIPLIIGVVILVYVLRRFGLLPRVHWPPRSASRDPDADPPGSTPQNPS
jgi:hypothetical protein